MEIINTLKNDTRLETSRSNAIGRDSAILPGSLGVAQDLEGAAASICAFDSERR